MRERSKGWNSQRLIKIHEIKRTDYPENHVRFHEEFMAGKAAQIKFKILRSYRIRSDDTGSASNKDSYR
jgi:hypothetical protein